MTTYIDPQVVLLIEEGGRWVDEPRPGEAFRIGDVQVQDIGYDEGGVITVEKVDRGTSNGVDLVTTENAVLQAYLALRAAMDWRNAKRLEVLTYDRLAIPTDYSVTEDATGRAEVRRSDGTVVARRLWTGDAEELAVALSYPLDVVVAAIKHPTGEPLWTRGSDRDRPARNDVY